MGYTLLISNYLANINFCRHIQKDLRAGADTCHSLSVLFHVRVGKLLRKSAVHTTSEQSSKALQTYGEITPNRKYSKEYQGENSRPSKVKIV